MSPKLQPVRGTHDILPDEFEKFHAVVTRARELATLYGFKEMATPVFEATEVFARSMGETSDVVSKEMFSFDTKGGESVTLRPEFTAGIVRAFLSNGMQQHLPLKLFSTGPLFRYERPQKGRQRQFHQVNFEWLGDASPEADVEIISLAGHLLYILSGKHGCNLHINTLGDKESRANYREALVSYLTPFANELSEDSQRRLIANPLRILDSKSEQDQKITANAPKMTDYLSRASKERFDVVCKLLEDKDIPFFQDMVIDASLVRGLDYYTDTVFEFVGEIGGLGSQSTVLAGGRYDGLVEQMGGNPTSSIGFAAGVERLLLLMNEPGFTRWKTQNVTNIIIIPLEDVPSAVAHSVAALLRTKLYTYQLESPTRHTSIVDVLRQGNLKKRMEKAAQRKATHVAILGSDEIKRFAFQLKNMETGAQQEVSLNALLSLEEICTLLDLPELDPGLRRDDEAQA